MESEHNEPEYKIVLTGTGAVGKSSILRRYHKNEFRNDSDATIGVDYVHTEVEYKGEKIKVQLWDTAGQERFRAVAGPYFRESRGAILVYDITSENSFQQIEYWRRELRNYRNDSECLLMIIGNKIDLEFTRVVKKIQAEEYAKEFNIKFFFETSAKIGTNVNTAIETFIQQIHDHNKNRPLEEEEKVDEETSMFLKRKESSVWEENGSNSCC